MNTIVEAEGEGNPARIQGWFHKVESTLTRFDPDSPLSQLNRLPSRWVVVPPLLFRAIHTAVHAAEVTGGHFDPTILPSLEAAGYTRSFDLGPTDARPPVPAGRWREIKLAPSVRAVWLPPGVRLDLGGIGKGLAVDGAMARVRGRRMLINAGGDLAIRTVPGDPPVLVDLEDPFHPDRTLATFGLYRGAAATSSTLGRRWGDSLHHIIDPVTGCPAASGVVSATVFAGTVARAETLAKAAVVLGPERGLRLLSSQGCHGLLVTDQKDVVLTPGLEEYRHETA